MKSLNFDLAIDLRRHPETRTILRLSGARYKIGYCTGDDDTWLSRCLELSPEIQDICSQISKPHITAQMCKLIQAIPSGNTLAEEYVTIPPISLSFNKECDKLIENYNNLLRAEFLVGIHPSVGSVIRQWPISHFASLADLLIERNNASVVVFGVKSEENLAQQMYKYMKYKDRMLSLVGKISLEEFMLIVKYCHLFIGNISGPCHIASVMGVPTLTIFGSQVIPHEWQPLGKYSMSVRVDNHCSPCYKSLPEQCEYNLKCLKLLWPEKVLDAVYQLMAISGFSVKARIERRT